MMLTSKKSCRENYYNFFDANRYARIVSGVWLVDKEKRPSWLYQLNLLYNTVLVLYAELIILPAEILILPSTVSDIEKFVKIFGLLLCHILGGLKTVLQHSNRRRIATYINILRDNKYTYEEYNGFKPDDIFAEGRTISRNITALFWTVGNGVGIVGSIAAIYSIESAEGENDNFAKNQKCLDFMPYPFVCPLPTDTKTQCKLAITYHAIAVLIFAWQIVSHDMLFATFVLNLKSHFIVNSFAFKTIRERCLAKLKLPPDYFALHDENVPYLDEKMLREVKKSTVHLQMLLDICMEVENMFSYVILFQALTSLFALATCFCLTDVNDLLSASTFSVMAFLSALTTQLIVYCYFGNELTLACESVRMSIYQSDWLSSSLHFKRYLLMNLCRLQKPAYITVGKFSTLTLNTLVSISRTSFSIVTLYNSMQRD